MADEKEKKKNEKPQENNKQGKQIEKLKEELEAAKKELEEAKAKEAERKDDYIRLMAEFDTFRRRTAEDKLALVSSASAETIKGLLPVLDDCESALKMLETSADEAAREGTRLIYNKLMDYLKTKGLSVIDAQGKEFDTDFHEALTQVPAPSEELKGKVMEVFQTGYMLNGKVIRYAKVVVGA